MRNTKLYLTKLLATVAVSCVAVFVSVSLMLSSANAPCHNLIQQAPTTQIVSTQNQQRGNANVDALCNRNNQQVNWVNWLFKRSDSPQFHFADLLELLSKTN
ncbi:hypothetical protein PN836_016030 [Ningiella sp. W23]|uniref:hypothetical protein n=1 Tax=Ningiella sp. W23 TaxID=3023715 RepID=UPI003757E0A0